MMQIRADKLVDVILDGDGNAARLLQDDAPPYVAHPTHQAQSRAISPQFLTYVKRVENPAKKGFNAQRKLWFPCADPAGGQTIGYGHRVQNEERGKFNRGLTDAQVEQLLVADLEAARLNVHRYIKSRYGVTLTLTPKQEQMLIDYAFNSGGLEKFPKMADAILRGDRTRMRGEYKRYATVDGSKRELSDRNAQFASTFMNENLDS